jgi:hypothetical protein
MFRKKFLQIDWNPTSGCVTRICAGCVGSVASSLQVSKNLGIWVQTKVFTNDPRHYISILRYQNLQHPKPIVSSLSCRVNGILEIRILITNLSPMYFLCVPVRSGHSGATDMAINCFWQSGDTFPLAGDIFLMWINDVWNSWSDRIGYSKQVCRLMQMLAAIVSSLPIHHPVLIPGT